MRKGLLHKPIVLFGPVIDKVIFTHVVVIGIPTIFYYCILVNGRNLLPLHVLIPILYFVTSVVVISEAIAAVVGHFPGLKRKIRRGIIQRTFRFLRVSSLPSRIRARDPRRQVPRSTIIVAAYLPNEQRIILDTLRHILTTVDRPEAGLEVILAYNTPVRLPVEEDLQRLAAVYPELRLLAVEGSHSKAENVNAALQIVTGEITCILDADHWPVADCLERAWSWLKSGQYDVVQGRNVIRNYSRNFLTRLVAIEFECMYGVSHPAKSLLVDTAMFCGSNGYWRTSVLRRIRLCPNALTEDIDATLRALLTGHRIVHDPNIVATELAPVDLSSFWSQRKRWAQGWLEVTLTHQLPLLRSPYLDLWQKFYWTILLLYSAAFHFIALQIFPMFFSLALSHSVPPPFTQDYVWATTLLTLLSGPCQALAGMRVQNSVVRYPLADFLLYCLLIPFYCILKNIIAVIAIYDHLLGETEWVVTNRGLREAPPPMVLTYAKQANR